MDIVNNDKLKTKELELGYPLTKVATRTCEDQTLYSAIAKEDIDSIMVIGKDGSVYTLYKLKDYDVNIDFRNSPNPQCLNLTDIHHLEFNITGKSDYMELAIGVDKIILQCIKRLPWYKRWWLLLKGTFGSVIFDRDKHSE